MDLFDKYGSYNYTSFTGKSGTWNIVGSETNFSNVKLPYNSEISDEVLKTLDTFRMEDGTFKTAERFKVIEQFNSGKITPLLGTEIVFKDNSKTKRRA